MTYPSNAPPPATQAATTPQAAQATEAARTSAQVQCPACGAFVPSTPQGWTRRMERCKGGDGQETTTTRLVPYSACASCGRGVAHLG